MTGTHIEPPEFKGVQDWPKDRAAHMVGWYSFELLQKTAADVALTSLLGNRVDGRLNQPLLDDDDDRARAGSGLPYFDRSGGDGDYWLDYVADLGEGWNSTYAIALGLSSALHETARGWVRSDALPAGTPAAATMPQGKLLVMGGDQIYPSASPSEYDVRLVRPYQAAYPKPTAPGALPERELFAIPGNHDWYDGLGAFTNLFLQKRTIGWWKTQQRRSYFALRLPHDWWLIAVDIPPERAVDELQKRWLVALTAQILALQKSSGRPASIILCLADPVWKVRARHRQTVQNNLRFVERLIARPGLERSVRLRIAGDYHHYQRHVSTRGGPVNLTCGGGGAFLHPTHGFAWDWEIGGEDVPARDAAPAWKIGEKDPLALEGPSFPTTDESAALAQRLLPGASLIHVLPRNIGLFLVMGALYGALAFTYVDSGWSIFLVWILIMFAGLTLLTKTDDGLSPRSAPKRALVLSACNGIAAFLLIRLLLWPLLDPAAVSCDGLMHAVSPERMLGLGDAGYAHLLRGTQAACMTLHTYHPLDLFVYPAQGNALTFPIQLLFAVLAGLAGVLASATIIPLYMFLSARRGVHWNEAFSLLRIQDYKSFLKLQLTAQGLAVHVMGLRTVPQDWHYEPGQAPRFAPPPGALSFQRVEIVTVPPAPPA